MQHSSSASSTVFAFARTTQLCGGVHSEKRFGNTNSHATVPVADAVGMWVMQPFKVKTTPPASFGLHVLDVWFANKRLHGEPSKWL